MHVINCVENSLLSVIRITVLIFKILVNSPIFFFFKVHILQLRNSLYYFVSHHIIKKPEFVIVCILFNLFNFTIVVGFFS